jgi:hypothetical protein
MAILGIKRRSAIVQASRFVKQGLLITAGRNQFLVSLKPIDWLAVAVEMYSPSYISLDSALNFHGLIDQIPRPIFLCTTRRPLSKSIVTQKFAYRNVADSLFFGFQRQGNTIMALPEKAVLDKLYFARRHNVAFHADEINFNTINWDRLFEFAKHFPNTVQKEIFLVYRQKDNSR